MPELPEVETLTRGLSGILIGKVVSSVETRKTKMWLGKPATELYGARIKIVRRIAKILIIDFSHNLSLLIHLKMTGQLIYVDTAGKTLVGGHPDDQLTLSQPSKYTHIIFHFADDSTLYLNDMRQFGYAHLMASEEVQKHGQIATIGIDPFTDPFSPTWLFDQLQRRPKTSVKQVLMDQTVIAGIGNIYADESLFEARILPSRRAASITADEAKRLHQAVLNILKKAIHYGGTSYKDYVHHTGAKGTMQDHLKVYRKQGSACPRCDGIIKRTVIGGRGTHYCSGCQK